MQQRIIHNQLKDAYKQTDIAIKLPETRESEVHFTVQGPKDTMFEGGIYHGKIVMPSNYPFSAPHIQILTPSGRFDVGQNICIDGYTAWHPDSWSPAKNITAIVHSVQSLFSDLTQQGIGYHYAPDLATVKELVPKSKEYVCIECGMRHADCFTQKVEK